MKNTTLGVIALVVVLLIGGYAFFNLGESNEYSVTGNTIEGGNGESQKIVLGMKDFNYYPNTIKVKADQPVEITLDDSVDGCLRAFTIKEFGVSKLARTPEDKIVFTPTKKGTFSFACTMGMAYGKIIVE
ncbi:MAG: hypothetical protein UR46_C0025G0002 [Parcubacteria group bacterium GW2011_GWA1_33_6]|nr:MAG: hypothetical protein UR46_C0025G0002 [Parcubacteria group bacterium GW2011_GWA1_33_6]